MRPSFLKELTTRIPADRLFLGEPMARHTTFRIGGPADVLIEAGHENEVRWLLARCAEEEIPLLIIGNGSNLLVADEGIRGVVLRIGQGLAACRTEGTRLLAGGGLRLKTLAENAAQAGLGGLAFAHGIPGTLGGGITMNAGAYGGELSAVVEQVVAVDPAGVLHTLSAPALDFSYRHSIFQTQPLTILEAHLRLAPADPQVLGAEMQRLRELRRQKQPLAQPSAGSTFQRPPDGFAASLIDQAGLRGKRVGGAVVSEKHAGFVVNAGDATALDVLRLMQAVRGAVYQQFHTLLLPEIRCVGAFAPGTLPAWEEAPCDLSY